MGCLDIDFVLIKPGTFIMGSPESEPEKSDNETLYQVTLTQGYYLQTTPVTQSQWEDIMGSNPSKFKGLDLPVETVSWLDTQAFIQKLNQQGEGTYRLPTEAEWEYACRAGSTTPFGIGNGLDLESSQANFNGNHPYGLGGKGIYRKRTTPVKTFSANAWGLYDMHGNVWEWCADWYEEYPTGAVSNLMGAETGGWRVLRGGSWSFNAGFCRSATRYESLPDRKSYLLGFRLVRLS